MKKLVLSALSILVAATSVFGFAPLFTQAYDAEYLAAFDWAKESGLTSMADADAFGPYRNLTREEYSKFIGKFGQDFLCLEENPEANYMYDDDDQISPYLADSVVLASKLGLMRGSNGNFYPTTFVSKAQVLATLVRGMEDYMDETVSPWYANYHAYAFENGITTVEDVNSFDRPVSRYEALLMLYRARDYDCDFEIVDGTGTVIGDNVATLVKSENSPAGENGTIYIAKTSTNNEVLKFDVTSTENGTLKTVTVKLNDSLMDRNSASVSITDADGVKLTNTRTFNNNSEAILSFTTPAMLTADQLKSYYVYFDFSGSVNQRGTVTVTNATLSNGAVNVSNNVISPWINTIDVSNQSTLKFDSQSTTAGVTCATNATYVYVGDTNRLLGRFSLENSSSTKSITVKAIRLKSSKNLNGIVNNLKLEVGTGVVPSTSVIDGKYVTFVLNYEMPYSTIRSFYIKGDVVGGDRDDPIQFQLDEASDVTARETDSNLSVNTTYSASTPNKYSTFYCVKEGSNTISRSDTVASMNVPYPENLVFLLRANVNTKSAVRADKIVVYVNNKTSTGLYNNPSRSAENFRLYVNGAMVDSTSTVNCPNTLGTATNPQCSVTFNYYGDLNAGANSLEVRFDSKSNPVVGDRISAKIDQSSIAFAGNAEYVSTQNDVVLSDFNGVAQGVEMIITSAAVDNISRTDGFANGKIMIKESTDFTAMKFALRANNVRDLYLNGFRVDLNLNPSVANANYVTDVMAYVDGVLVATESFNNGTTVTFNGLGILVAKGSQKEVTLKVTTTSEHPETIVGAAGDAWYTVSNFDLDDSEGRTVTNTTTLVGAKIDVAGSVTVQCKNVNPIQTSIIALSSEPVKVAEFEFKAQNGNAVISELSLANVLSGTNVVPSTYDVNNLPTLGYDTSADGVMLEFYVGATKVGEASLINAIAYGINLNGGNGIVLPNNTSVVLTVKAKGSATSSSLTKVLRLGVVPNAGYSVIGGTAQTMISAQNSSAVATLASCGQVANSQLIRNNKITITTSNTNPQSLSAGQEQPVYQGNIVIAGDSVQLAKVKLSTSTNTAGFDFSTLKVFVNGSEYTAAAGNVTFSADPLVLSNAGVTNLDVTFPTPITLNGTVSFEVRATVNGTVNSTNTETINTRIQQGASTDYTAYSTPGAVPANATVVWGADDNSTTYWYTDAGLAGLATQSYLLRD